ncbi:MAG: HAD-IA family hydrolase [Opitutaceae bacterium]|nr:HAD-IA family hydrolase [Opitutaceae bacterium]
MQLHIPPGDFAGTIFDLDGTLIDSMPVHYHAWDRAMRDFGLGHALDEDYFYSLGGVPTRQVAELFAVRYGLDLDASEVMEHKEKLYLQLLPTVKVIEPVVEAARRAAARHPVSIATGGAPEVAYPALDATGLRSLFSIVVTPHDVAPGRGKPAPDMFLLAAKKMGVPPDRCLVFEDAEPGLAAARAAGMATVRVPSRTSRSDSRP